MIVYKATNLINGKGYIGLSQETLDKRRQNHYNDVNYGSDYYFHRALRKYKKKDWKWEIIDTCDTRKEAGILEEKYIAEHGTFGDGYNLTTGGEKGWEISEETRKKMSKASSGRVPWNKGKKGVSDETRKRLSESHMGVSNGPHSEETKRKIGAAHKGKTVKHTTETRKKMSISAKKRWKREKSN